ncbi:putative sensor domain DACNV-containing protein [Sorangium sp. So ce834]|uniref:putative sensor domain DACNV-containing protein n=1 Tax=Sorangium sp. So ce834 TaxID=3133321 RepID=UPI003F5EFD5A
MSNLVRFPHDQALVEHVATCTARIFTEQKESGANPPSPPTSAQISQILSLAFLGSLEREEGRKVTFTLFLIEEGDFLDYEFDTPLTLTPKMLARLSAAMDPSRTYIGIRPTQNGLKIAGIHYFGQGRPSHLVVRALDPGVLVTRYYTRLILTYRRGEAALYPGVFDLTQDVERALSPSFSSYINDPSKAQIGMCFTRIAEHMVRMGHGGALLVLPHELDWKSHTTSHILAPKRPTARVRVSDSENTRAYITNEDITTTIMKPTLGDQAAEPRLQSALESIAHLTGTDGMTVMTPDLTVLCFGAFFKTDQSHYKIRVEYIDPYSGTNSHPESGEIADVGGARHQSAAIACNRFPGSTAVVASHDGALSSMRWDEERQAVRVHRHLELTLDL